jgi:hypothetical protein
MHYTRPNMPDDPFAMLGLPRSFDLDPAVIRRAHLERVTALRASAGSAPSVAEGGLEPGGQRAGTIEDRLAELNRARALLEDAEQRANALLDVLGGPGRDRDRTLPPGFLERMLEVNERVEAAVAGHDQPEIHRLLDEVEAQRHGHIRRVGELFARLADPACAGESGVMLGQVRSELNAWRYIERLIERLERAEDSELL